VVRGVLDRGIRFDASKTKDEKILDQILTILSETIPEQIADTMEDYVKVLNLLHRIKDPQFSPLINQLKDLYAYPTRDTHNAFMQELHEYKEMIHENRIQNVIRQNKQLGDTTKSSKSVIKWLVAGAVILVILKFR